MMGKMGSERKGSKVQLHVDFTLVDTYAIHETTRRGEKTKARELQNQELLVARADLVLAFYLLLDVMRV